jgi:hypothetical protein
MLSISTIPSNYKLSSKSMKSIYLFAGTNLLLFTSNCLIVTFIFCGAFSIEIAPSISLALTL